MHGQAALSSHNFANLRAYGKRRSSYAALAASGSAELRHGAARTGSGWTVPVMSSAAAGFRWLEAPGPSANLRHVRNNFANLHESAVICIFPHTWDISTRCPTAKHTLDKF